MGCFVDPTHRCSRASSLLISVAILPSSRMMVIRSMSLRIFILSPHGSHAMPPLVPYFRSSGTLLCTPDLVDISFFTPASTAATSAADTFMNRSLYAALSNITAWHKYLAGIVLMCFRAILFVLLNTSRTSVLSCCCDLPKASWWCPRWRISSDGFAMGKSSSGPSSGVHRSSADCQRRSFSAPRIAFVHSIASPCESMIHSRMSMCDFFVFISCPVHPQKSSTLSISRCMLRSLYCTVVRMTFPVPPANARFIQLTMFIGSFSVQYSSVCIRFSPWAYVPSSANIAFDTATTSSSLFLTTYGSGAPVSHTPSFQSIVHTHPSGDRSSPCAYAPMSASNSLPGPYAVST